MSNNGRGLFLARFLLNPAMVINRRAFTLSMLSFSGELAAGPLVDIESGTSLFQNGATTKPSLLNSASNFGAEMSVAEIRSNSNPFLIHNINTKETLNLLDQSMFFSQAAINEFFRDWRENKTKPIDPRLLFVFKKTIRAASKYSNFGNVNVHSGYRTKSTNEMLRTRSNAVAEKSFHILGKAIDFSIDGLSSETLGELVRNQFDGGVGVYPNFVHIDSGPKRTWYA